MDKSTDNTNLSKVLERGENNISLIQEYAIILLGLTRSGKSTSFNWMLGKNIIGSKDKSGLSYVVNENDDNFATVAGGFQSVTLPPNVYMSFKIGWSLVDMPGFKDSRDYIGVIGVSYFLKSIFERARKVKFLIVMTQTQLMEDTGDSIKKVFNGFLDMFNIKSMTPDHLRQLK
jgi:GTP-binding protein EngB required for normal cell division